MTVRLSIDASDPTPPYEQLRRQLASAIETGALAPGTKLPPVRQLAGDLGCATGTVARTFKELEQARYVRTGRGAGTVVQAVPRPAHPVVPPPEVDEQARAFVHRVRLAGASPQQVRDAVDRALRAEALDVHRRD